MSSMVRYLLDTNVVSTLRRPESDVAVRGFLSSLETTDLFISVMTLGELRKGVANKEKRGTSGVAAWARWVERAEILFKGRVLPVNADIARLWGDYSAERTRPVVDTLIGATAAAHNLTLVTRNVRDFRDLPIKLINPWAD